MKKEEQNPQLVIDSFANTKQDTNQNRNLFVIIKENKDVISLFLLIIGALNAILSQLFCYVYKLAISDFYKINIDYVSDKSLSFWFIYTLTILIAVLAISLIYLYAIIISINKQIYFVTSLVHVILLLYIEAYLIYWEKSYCGALVVLFLFFCLYYLIYSCVYLFNSKKIFEWKLEHNEEKYKRSKNEKKKIKIRQKINKYSNIVKYNIRPKKNSKITIAMLVIEYTILLLTVFLTIYIMGVSIARQERTYNIIAEPDIKSFEPDEIYQVIISETSDYIYTFECIINTNDKESNLIIYNDVLTSVKKPDTFTQVRVTFNSVEFINRLTEKETTD